MEYERIDKVQTGILSPSKLRLKLTGGLKRKDGSNNNSARTSPAKLNDVDFVKNSLLADDNGGDLVEEGCLKDCEGASSLQIVASNLEASSSIKLSEEGLLPKELGDMGLSKIQHLSNGHSGNSSTVHPVRGLEEDNLDYDSNASSSSFEFHKGQRSLQNRLVRTFSRPVPSKWNDAEKWIVNRQQHGESNFSKKNMLQSQVNRQQITNSDQKTMKPSEKFSFVPPGIPEISDPVNKTTTGLIDLCPLSIDQKEVDHKASFASERHIPETTVPGIRSVSMRDMGTEMTPVPSQEPSRTATPVGATTPIRSPTSSIPSTPRRGAPASTPVEGTTDDESDRHKEGKQKKLSEEELHLKTRREIVALGVQLGKMNIAAWASKDDKQNNASSQETIDAEQLERVEYENRAAAWEEAEKSKHAARFKREEIKIEAWESHRKAKLEAEMRRIEAQVEQMRVIAHEKMMKKITTAKQRSEEKRVAAEAKRNQQAAKTSAQAEYIRQTGRIPSSHFMCCSWL